MKTPILFILISILLLSSASAFDTTGLELYYNFTSNTKAYDSSGNGNDGTYNDSESAAGFNGLGRYFDQTQDWIEVKENDATDPLDNFADGITISGWFRFNETGATETHRLVHKNLAYSMNYVTGSGYNEIRCRVYNDTGSSVEVEANINMGSKAWEMVTCLFNKTSIVIYINDTLANSGALQGSLDDTSADLIIGLDEDLSGSDANMTIDELSIFSRPLSASEIADKYSIELAGGRITDISTPTERQTKFYFCQNGSDTTGNGSLNAPYKTITKMNTLSLVANDSALFCRGGRWDTLYDAEIDDLSGNSTANITYGAYGVGDRPIFTRSFHANSTTNWTASGVTNVWNTTFAISDDVGLIIFNNGSSWGSKVSTFAAVDTAGEFYYDTATDKVSLYTVGNPASLYTDIELSKKGNIFDLNNVDYIKIEGLDLRYSGKDAVFITDSSHIYVLNNSVSWIGGSYQSGTLRYGNGIEATGDGSYIDINYNTLYQAGKDAGISLQSSSGEDLTHNNIKYNTVSKSRYCLEFFNHDGTDGDFDYTYIDHNTCYMSGGGYWGTNNGMGIRTGAFDYPVIDFNITNNIFYSATTYGIYIDNDLTSSEITLNNNLYYEDNNADIVVSYNAVDYAYSNFANYQSTTGQDGDSATGDAQFIDAEGGDFRPVSTSVACSMSSTGSYVGALPCAGNQPPTATLNSPANNTGYETDVPYSVQFDVTPYDIDSDEINVSVWSNNGSIICNYPNITSGDMISCSKTIGVGETLSYNISVYDGSNYVNYGIYKVYSYDSDPIVISGSSILFNKTLSQSNYTYSINFTQKPYIISGWINVDNINPSALIEYVTANTSTCSADITDCGYVNDNNYATTAFLLNKIESYYNITKTHQLSGVSSANLTYSARYKYGTITAWCKTTTGSYVQLASNTESSGSITDYSVNVALSSSCIQDNVEIKFGLLNEYLSSSLTALYDSKLILNKPYGVNIDSLNIYNSTSESNNSISQNITQAARNMSLDSQLIFNFYSYLENTFNSNITIDYIYNQSVIFNLHDATGAETNASCYMNGVSLGFNSTFNTTFVSSLENLFLCSRTGVYSNTSYTMSYPEDVVNMTMVKVQAFECTGGANESFAYNFTVMDEDNKTLMGGNNLYVDLDFGGSTLSFQKFNTSFVQLCTQTGQSFIADGFVQIDNGYSTKYFLRDATYDDTLRTVLVYNKEDTTDYSSLILTVRDESYKPANDIIVKMERYYPENHTWIIVQQDKTGEFGTAFFNIKEENTEYKFMFYRNATFIDETNEIKLKCTSGLCEVSFVLIPEETTATDIGLVLDFSNTTKVADISWNDGTGSTSSVRVKITKETYSGQSVLSDTTTYSSTGSVELNLSSQTGTVEVNVYVNGDKIPTLNQLLTLESTTIGTFLTFAQQGFLSVIILLVFIGIGIISPAAVIVMALVALWFISLLGINPIVNITFVIIATVIGIIVGSKVE